VILLCFLLFAFCFWLLAFGFWLFAFAFRVPFRSDAAGGNNPKGGVQGCTPFFYATGANRK